MVTEPERQLHDDCGGVLCLDFVNTLDRVAGRPWVETLEDYGDLCLWSAQAGSLPREQVRALERAGRRRPDEAAAVLERGRELREATYRIFAALIEGEAAAPADLDTLNAELASALAHVRVETTAEGFAWGWGHDPDSLGSPGTPGTPEALEAPLWPIARSAAELLTSEDRQRVKECASDTCLWLYLDRTKNRARRWCAMKTCGNRAKVREHRRRKRAGGSGRAKAEERRDSPR